MTTRGHHGLMAAGSEGGGGDGYRYWGVLWQSNGGSTRCGMFEMQMREVASGADVCTGGTAGATVTDSGSSAANAFDNNLGTDWAGTPSAGFPQRLHYDFGAGNEKTIVEITMQMDSAYAERAPVDFKIQASHDGSAWDDIKTYTGQTGWGGALRTYSAV